MGRPVPTPDWNYKPKEASMAEQMYEQAVAEARTLVKRSEDDQWRLAELSWERSQPQRGREGLPEGKVSVSQWARDVELSESYVRDLRAVWERFGSESPRPKFKDVIIEVHSASGYEAKLERGARQALADPEAVRQAIEENPEVRQAAIEVIKQEQTKAREQLDDVASDRGWTEPEHELAAQNLIDPAVPDTYKDQLLSGQADPVAFTEQGEPGYIPDTVERIAREPSDWDGARQYSRWRRSTEDLLAYTPEQVLLKKDREYIQGMTEDLPRFIEYQQKLLQEARAQLTYLRVISS